MAGQYQVKTGRVIMAWQQTGDFWQAIFTQDMAQDDNINKIIK